MKNLLYFLFLSLLCFSCGDPCDDVDCGPGTCVEGTCECPEGYFGTNCQTKDIDRYTGTWVTQNLTCNGIDFEDITFVFEEGATVTDLRFYDLEDPDALLDVLYDDDQLTIPAQVMDGSTISGTGIIDENNIMTLTLLVVDPDGNVANCEGTFTLQ